MNTQEQDTILKSIEVLDKTADDIRKANAQATSTLAEEKRKLAVQVFDNSEYIKEYETHFYDKFEDSFFEEDGCLARFNSFDFSKFPENIKEELKEYMQDNYCMYYHDNYGNEGFTVSSFDNIHISYDNELWADFSRKGQKISDDLDLFLKIELLQYENGIYPDIVYTGYYGDYKDDYTTPEEYRFLKLGMHRENEEKKQAWLMQEIVNLYDREVYDISDNMIVSDFTPDFIEKINHNLNVEVSEVNMQADFNLTITYYIPTLLKEKDLEKLNVKYEFDKYGDTLITVEANIKEYIENKLEEYYK